MSTRSTDQLAAEALELLKAQAQVNPDERFQKLVEIGLIDEEGQLTKDYGGDAEPEHHAAETTPHAVP